MGDTVKPLLELRSVYKSYGAIRVLRGIDIHINPGEVVGLVGDNGAGKSTLIKTLSGIVRPEEGEYLFDGRPQDIKGPHDVTALGVQTVYQDLALCDNLDAVQNLFLGRELVGGPLGLRRVRRAEEEQRARKVLRQLRLDSISLTRPVSAMSGGQRQNIAIARSILWQPKVVLLDEPTAALSHSAAEQVGKLIRTLADEGLGVLVVSHDIHHFVLDVTDRIVVLRLGAVVAEFDSKKVTGETVVNAMVGGNEGVNSAR
ncbi:ATP-binding cassette domain-containing protein [Microbacterium sp. No. 7]|uniref:ATP-binding cassette domain-containing protein n=1 Tax=Microbacterium sp. No. 7 TaxID=1714373 RepID=UPI0006D0899B|nr:ATP-binding cassette domain-containing protein [Microbacterium sp. No. 7]ALJ21764.1 sugar ABC transporter ATP-binding protein [Microbacterium sp. No. 7]